MDELRFLQSGCHIWARSSLGMHSMGGVKVALASEMQLLMLSEKEGVHVRVQISPGPAACTQLFSFASLVRLQQIMNALRSLHSDSRILILLSFERASERASRGRSAPSCYVMTRDPSMDGSQSERAFEACRRIRALFDGGVGAASSPSDSWGSTSGLGQDMDDVRRRWRWW